MAPDDLSFDLSAARWRRNASDERAFIEALAVRLEQALPGMVTITRHFALFAKDKPLHSLTVRLGDVEYALVQEKAAGSILTTKGKVVRGVRLKSEELPFVEWLNHLSTDLEQYSNEHQDTRQALEEFLLGD